MSNFVYLFLTWSIEQYRTSCFGHLSTGGGGQGGTLNAGNWSLLGTLLLYSKLRYVLHCLSLDVFFPVCKKIHRFFCAWHLFWTMNVQCVCLYDEMVAELGTIETIPIASRVPSRKFANQKKWKHVTGIQVTIPIQNDKVEIMIWPLSFLWIISYSPILNVHFSIVLL